MYHAHAAKGTAAEAEWNKLFESYGQEHKTLHAELSRRLRGELPENWEKSVSNSHAFDLHTLIYPSCQFTRQRTLYVRPVK